MAALHLLHFFWLRHCQKSFSSSNLMALDCLLIFLEDSIGMDAIEIAKLAKMSNLPACFVRSKCDCDLFGNASAIGKRSLKNKIAHLDQDQARIMMNKCRDFNLQQIFLVRTKFEEYFQQHNLAFPYYFISSPVLRYKIHRLQENHTCDSCEEPLPYNFEEDFLLNFIAFESAEWRNPNAIAHFNRTTPLHRAVKQKDLSMVMYLLANGAPQDVQDEDGNTALHLAVLVNSVIIVQLLLCFDFRKGVKNHEGKVAENLSKT